MEGIASAKWESLKMRPRVLYVDLKVVQEEGRSCDAKKDYDPGSKILLNTMSLNIF